jgi:methylphosphotriester-DNA--protein-cysteine methyltransferase|nr:MAG TPA: DNA methyl phosphotriester repair domain protein [Caudoviricetes sp.]
MSTAFSTTYVGSVNSNKFHYTYCRYADRIYESNKIYFSSRDEAINSGYIPCKVCCP